MAKEVVQEASRATLEAALDRAVACLKQRTTKRDHSAAVKEVWAVVSLFRRGRNCSVLSGQCVVLKRTVPHAGLAGLHSAGQLVLEQV